MSTSTPAPVSAPRRSTGHSVRHFGPRIVVVIYLLFMLIASGGLALQCWPDNPFRQRLYVVEAERLAMLQITAEGLVDLDHAINVASRLPAADENDRPNRADLNALLNQLAFARYLSESEIDLPVNPLQWNREHTRLAVQNILLPARRTLENRGPKLLPAKLQAKPWVVITRTIFPPVSPPLTVPLTNSEQARVAAILADMHNPRETSAGGEIERKIRPLLDRLQDTDFILLVIALGAWGASAQALASLAAYLGQRRYNDSWVIYYLTRPLIGATLAFAFYVLLRGGLLTRDASWTDINHVGYAAIAVLVGFFSTEALENMKRVASGLFSEKSSVDNLTSSGKPELRELRWISDDHLEIHGEHFNPHSQVVVNGHALSTPVHFVNARVILCVSPLIDLPEGGRLKVINPGTPVTTSDELPIPPHPTTPGITAMHWKSPTELEIEGRRFGESIAVLIGGKRSMLSTVVSSPTRITIVDFEKQIKPGVGIQIVNLTAPAGVSDEKPVPKRVE